MYSQNEEEKHILSYFRGQQGTLIDIGANDGETLSNSRALMLQGWKGVFVEPSPLAYERLLKLYNDNENAICYNVAIGAETKEVDFFESGQHLGKGDVALLSTTIESEMGRWKQEKFIKGKAMQHDWQGFLERVGILSIFDFITIDAEGMDYEILSQIDLTNTKMVCVEHNQNNIQQYINYCKQFGMRELYCSYENIIMAI